MVIILWQGFCAASDGLVRGGTFGWRMAPDLGFLLNLITGWALPTLAATIMGAMGGLLGSAAFFIACFEALAQFFVREPYRKPIARILVDWLPEV